MSPLSKSGTPLPAKRKLVTVLGNGRANQHGPDRSSNSVRYPINIVHPFSPNGFPVSLQLLRAAGRTASLGIRASTRIVSNMTAVSLDPNAFLAQLTAPGAVDSLAALATPNALQYGSPMPQQMYISFEP